MSMIREVKVVAQFTTGTTVDGKAQAENHTLRLLRDLLKKHNIATEGTYGKSLFILRIQDVTSEEI